MPSPVRSAVSSSEREPSPSAAVNSSLLAEFELTGVVSPDPEVGRWAEGHRARFLGTCRRSSPMHGGPSSTCWSAR